MTEIVWNAYLTCLGVNVACSESWKWKRRRRDSWHRGLLLSESRTYQAASWTGWPGIRGWVWLPRKRLHPILQQSPCGEEGKAPPRTHTQSEMQKNLVNAVLVAIREYFVTGQKASQLMSLPSYWLCLRKGEGLRTDTSGLCTWVPTNQDFFLR